MSTLKAGSYLKMLSDPQLDLMDIVNEEAPQFRTKEEHWIQEAEVKIGRKRAGSDDWDMVKSYHIPIAGISDVISSENTHGLRFTTCHQRRESFTVKPRNVEANRGFWAYNGSDNPADWDWHQPLGTRLSTGPSAGQFASPFGLLPWDEAVDNELFPGYPDWPVDLINQDEDPLSVDEELVRAYDVIRPAVTSDTSLLVTLAEVRDVKSLFTEPMSFADRLIHTIGRKSAKKWTFSSILTDKDALTFIAKSLAKGHLYTEFGLKQTVRDISALFSTFWSLDSLVRTILSQTGSNTRHYSVPVYQKTEEKRECRYQDYNWIIIKNWQSTLSRKFVVTMKYTTELVDAFGQPISPDDTQIVKLGAAMDTLGVNLNPAILWDVVPFSFVVDYFVGIGDWLERFKRSNLNFTFGVEDSCYSIKREITTWGSTDRWTAKWNGQAEHPYEPIWQGCQEWLGTLDFNHYIKTYDRIRFVPSARMLTGLDAPDFRLPSIGQLKILGSMLTANVPISGRRR